MQPLEGEANTKQLAQLESARKNAEVTEARIGMYYRKLTRDQRGRFDRIVNGISKKEGICVTKNPLELILARQIALNTVRIEQGELDILNGVAERYSHDAEKWLLLLQKERREAMKDLVLLLRTGSKKGQINKFSDIRDSLREEDGLEKSVIPETPPTGHERRFYDDDIIRTAK